MNKLFKTLKMQMPKTILDHSKHFGHIIYKIKYN